MKKTTMRVVVILLAIALLLGIMLPLLSSLAMASGQVTQGDIDELKGELADITAEKKKFSRYSAPIRLPRIAEGGIGMDSSISLSCASKIAPWA